MGLFGPKRIPCPAGAWTTIVATSFAQMPKSWTVTFEGPAAGEYEVKKSAWIFPGAPVRSPLAPKITLERGYWNTFYSVRVCPGSDTVANVD